MFNFREANRQRDKELLEAVIACMGKMALQEPREDIISGAVLERGLGNSFVLGHLREKFHVNEMAFSVQELDAPLEGITLTQGRELQVKLDKAFQQTETFKALSGGKAIAYALNKPENQQSVVELKRFMPRFGFGVTLDPESDTIRLHFRLPGDVQLLGTPDIKACLSEVVGHYIFNAMPNPKMAAGRA